MVNFTSVQALRLSMPRLGDLAVVKDNAYIKIERPELHELEATVQMNTSVNAEQNARMDEADAIAATWHTQ